MSQRQFARSGEDTLRKIGDLDGDADPALLQGEEGTIGIDTEARYRYLAERCDIEENVAASADFRAAPLLDAG